MACLVSELWLVNNGEISEIVKLHLYSHNFSPGAPTVMILV